MLTLACGVLELGMCWLCAALCIGVVCPAASRSTRTASACSDNYIGALGAAVLANALKSNAALTGLHIKGNELGNEGVKALCEAFRAREGRVSALDFGNNRRAARQWSTLLPPGSSSPLTCSTCRQVCLGMCDHAMSL